MFDPPPEVIGLFCESGWTPGRNVSIPPFIPSDHPAAEVLRRYAGLTVGKCGLGMDAASSDICFRHTEFDSFGDDDEIRTWQSLLNSRLISVAEVHHSHGELFIADDGRCFGRSYIHDAVYFEGNSFSVAVQNILTGIRARPMLRPDQPTVALYGIDFTAESPETYDWSRS